MGVVCVANEIPPNSLSYLAARGTPHIVRPANRTAVEARRVGASRGALLASHQAAELGKAAAVSPFVVVPRVDLDLEFEVR